MIRSAWGKDTLDYASNTLCFSSLKKIDWKAFLIFKDTFLFIINYFREETILSIAIEVMTVKIRLGVIHSVDMCLMPTIWKAFWVRLELWRVFFSPKEGELYKEDKTFTKGREQSAGLVCAAHVPAACQVCCIPWWGQQPGIAGSW